MLVTTVTTSRTRRICIPAINVKGGKRKLPNKKELGVWIPIEKEMKVLTMSGIIDHAKLEGWLGELGDADTPLDNEDEVRIGEDESGTRILILRLLRAYRGLTKDKGDCPPSTALDVQHHIDTGVAAPIMMKRRRYTQTEDAIIEENVDKMLKAGVIEDGNGGWGFPVVMVRKKDGEVRFCIDYRAFNEVTKKDVYPLPRIDETLEALGDARLFKTLDLRSGYWQNIMALGDHDKTASTTKQGLYRFTRVPFALMNALPTFQRMMNSVLRGLTWLTCLVYQDDIVVFTHDGVERHVVELATILDGVRPLQRLVTAVHEFPRPRDATKVKRFVHLVGYYRKFIEPFGSIMATMSSYDGSAESGWPTTQVVAYPTGVQVRN
ncbi:unnamed protein product [Phytophthora fragariaefolia]|uniref:Unnamed protein product n=1 Tax=Phytophthora fragariaefolia TaxID=1490495 RepID=A0A9W6U7V4_9STRA|nr:unnamed protein product [Phytophthora fragariaefolia]